MAKEKTYADRAKQIMNKYKIRLGENFDKGDKLSLDAMNQELGVLQQEQEQSRIAKQQADQQFQESAVQTFRDGGKLTNRQRSTISDLLGPSATYEKGGKLMDIKEDMGEGVGELFSEIREGDPKEIKALRQLGYLPHYPGHKALMGGGQHKMAYGGKIPDKPSLSSTGLAAGKKPSQYSEQQLRLGIDVEHEHTKNNALAVKIAMDHLEENPNYYGKGNKAQAEKLAQQHAAADAAKFATGGNLPMYEGPGDNPNYIRQRPWTAQDYMLSAQTAGNGFGQTPYGTPSYPYPQYFGDTMLDNFNQIGNVGTNQFQGFRNPNPNDLISGRSPQDPLQRGAAAKPYTLNPVMMKGLGMPGRASMGLGQGNVPATTPNTPSIANSAIAANTPGDTSPGNIFGSAEYDNMMGNQMPFDGGTYDQMPSTPQGAMARIEQSQAGPEGEDYQFRAPWWGAAATGIGALLANRQLDLPEDQYKAQQVVPNLVDYSREREQFGRDRDIANQMIRRGAAGFGSRSKLMQNLQAGATGTQRQEGRLFSKSLQGEENQNAVIKNQASQFNARERSVADRLNTQTNRENTLINARRRDQQIGDLFGAVTGYGRDLMAADVASAQLAIKTPEDYRMVTGKDSGLRKFFQVSSQPKRQYYGKGNTV